MSDTSLTSASTTESCGGIGDLERELFLAGAVYRLAQVLPALAGQREFVEFDLRKFAEFEQIEAVIVIVRKVRLEHFVEHRHAILGVGEAAEIEDRAIDRGLGSARRAERDKTVADAAVGDDGLMIGGPEQMLVAHESEVREFAAAMRVDTVSRACSSACWSGNTSAGRLTAKNCQIR